MFLILIYRILKCNLISDIIVIIYGKAMRMRRLPSRPFSNEDPPKTHSEIVFYEQFALLGNCKYEYVFFYTNLLNFLKKFLMFL